MIKTIQENKVAFKDLQALFSSLSESSQQFVDLFRYKRMSLSECCQALAALLRKKEFPRQDAGKILGFLKSHESQPELYADVFLLHPLDGKKIEDPVQHAVNGLFQLTNLLKSKKITVEQLPAPFSQDQIDCLRGYVSGKEENKNRDELFIPLLEAYEEFLKQYKAQFFIDDSAFKIALAGHAPYKNEKFLDYLDTLNTFYSYAIARVTLDPETRVGRKNSVLPSRSSISDRSNLMGRRSSVSLPTKDKFKWPVGKPVATLYLNFLLQSVVDQAYFGISVNNKFDAFHVLMTLPQDDYLNSFQGRKSDNDPTFLDNMENRKNKKNIYDKYALTLPGFSLLSSAATLGFISAIHVRYRHVLNEKDKPLVLLNQDGLLDSRELSKVLTEMEAYELLPKEMATAYELPLYASKIEVFQILMVKGMSETDLNKIEKIASDLSSYLRTYFDNKLVDLLLSGLNAYSKLQQVLDNKVWSVDTVEVDKKEKSSRRFSVFTKDSTAALQVEEVLDCTIVASNQEDILDTLLKSFEKLLEQHMLVSQMEDSPEKTRLFSLFPVQCFTKEVFDQILVFCRSQWSRQDGLQDVGQNVLRFLERMMDVQERSAKNKGGVCSFFESPHLFSHDLYSFYAEFLIEKVKLLKTTETVEALCRFILTTAIKRGSFGLQVDFSDLLKQVLKDPLFESLSGVLKYMKNLCEFFYPIDKRASQNSSKFLIGLIEEAGNARREAPIFQITAFAQLQKEKDEESAQKLLSLLNPQGSHQDDKASQSLPPAANDDKEKILEKIINQLQEDYRLFREGLFYVAFDFLSTPDGTYSSDLAAVASKLVEQLSYESNDEKVIMSEDLQKRHWCRILRLLEIAYEDFYMTFERTLQFQPHLFPKSVLEQLRNAVSAEHLSNGIKYSDIMKNCRRILFKELVSSDLSVPLFVKDWVEKDDKLTLAQNPNIFLPGVGSPQSGSQGFENKLLM